MTFPCGLACMGNMMKMRLNRIWEAGRREKAQQELTVSHGGWVFIALSSLLTN